MRKITDDDIKKYRPMVESFLRNSVVKNWNEASLSKSKDEISLGNSGMTMRDFRQFLNTEVFVALTKYDPNYKTPEGRSVQESTFVYRHITFRIGQALKRLTRRRQGYGVWSIPIEKAFGENKNQE